MKAVKLYDLRKKNYPQGGKAFRTIQVFRCWVCGALTNEMYWGGMGPRLGASCPSSSKHWHHELEAKLKYLERAQNRPWPPSMRKSVEEECQKEMKSLREKFKKLVKYDIRGRPDPKQEDEATWVHSVNARGRTCKYCWML